MLPAIISKWRRVLEQTRIYASTASSYTSLIPASKTWYNGLQYCFDESICSAKCTKLLMTYSLAQELIDTVSSSEINVAKQSNLSFIWEE